MGMLQAIETFPIEYRSVMKNHLSLICIVLEGLGEFKENYPHGGMFFELVLNLTYKSLTILKLSTTCMIF